MSDFDDGEAEGQAEDLGEWQTGYRKPPVEHRFAKGISGNPKGRPKGSRKLPEMVGADDSLAALVRKAGRQMRVIREGEDVREMPTVEIIIQRAFTTAAKGDPRALKVALEMLAAAEQVVQKEVDELREASLQFQASWNCWCRQVRNEHSDLTEYPEPADVKIDPLTGFTTWKSRWLKKQHATYEGLSDKRHSRLSALAHTGHSLYELQRLFTRTTCVEKPAVALGVLREAMRDGGPLAEAVRYWDDPVRRKIAEMTPDEKREAMLEIIRAARNLKDPVGTKPI
jgi:hypothetical protein